MKEEGRVFEALRRIRALALRQNNVGLVAKANKAEKLLRTEMQVADKQGAVKSFAVIGGKIVS